MVNFQVVLITDDDDEVWLSLWLLIHHQNNFKKVLPFFVIYFFNLIKAIWTNSKNTPTSLCNYLVIRIKRQVVSSFKFRHFESGKKQEETGEIVVQEIRSSKRKISSKRKLELIAKTSATHLAAGQISRVSGGSCSILV